MMTIAEKALALLDRGRDFTLLNAARAVEPLDTRVLVLMRCALAAAALVVVLIDPGTLTWQPDAGYFSLVVYLVFSIGIAIVSWRNAWPPTPRALHWIDLALFGFLIILSGGPGSIFFLYFIYAILNASFSTGFEEGALITAASAGLFAFTALAYLSAGQKVDVGSTALRAISLFVFGYAIAYLGGHERLLRRRLALLKNINDLWSPRFGSDHLYGVNLDLLREFYDANSCVLVLRRSNPSPHYVMYSALRGRPGHSAAASKVSDDAAAALISLPDTIAAVHHDPAGTWMQRLRGFLAYDIELGATTSSFREECAAWLNLLDARALVTVPYMQRDSVAGRLFVTTNYGVFARSDIAFLMHVTNAMMTVVENMSLVEELATSAAEQERRMMSRDVHDTTIQPYIGLKLALEALSREADKGSVLSKRIGELVEMAEMTIRDLRDYASTLKGPMTMPGQFLVSAVKRQADRMKRFYGIDVDVEYYISPDLKGRLAGESYQIISEGLSNILRHTSARRAFVQILCENSQLLLKIGNESSDNEQPRSPAFTPRSINERARNLGGSMFVERDGNSYTVVNVAIPFSAGAE